MPTIPGVGLALPVPERINFQVYVQEIGEVPVSSVL